MFGLSIGFQNGMSWPHSNKTHKLVRVLGNGPFLDKEPGVVGHGAISLTQQYNSYAEQNLKFSVYFMQQIKSYAIFTFRQTHRRTFCTLYTWARFFLYGNLYLSLHYVPLLASLTHSLHLWRMIFSIKTILKNCLLLLKWGFWLFWIKGKSWFSRFLLKLLFYNTNYWKSTLDWKWNHLRT